MLSTSLFRFLLLLVSASPFSLAFFRFLPSFLLFFKRLANFLARLQLSKFFSHLVFVFSKFSSDKMFLAHFSRGIKVKTYWRNNIYWRYRYRFLYGPRCFLLVSLFNLLISMVHCFCSNIFFKIANPRQGPHRVCSCRWQHFKIVSERSLLQILRHFLQLLFLLYVFTRTTWKLQ